MIGFKAQETGQIEAVDAENRVERQQAHARGWGKRRRGPTRKVPKDPSVSWDIVCCVVAWFRYRQTGQLKFTSCMKVSRQKGSKVKGCTALRPEQLDWRTL
jgi:hypothetical protein